MTDKAEGRWVCSECHEFVTTYLQGISPFDGEPIVGCPVCKACSSLATACWKCEAECSSGTPTKEHGYVWACHRHAPERT